MYFLLPGTLPTELYKLISNSFQNYTWLLNMPAYCFGFNVYKQANVNMVIRSWQHYINIVIRSWQHHSNSIYLKKTLQKALLFFILSEVA